MRVPIYLKGPDGPHYYEDGEFIKRALGKSSGKPGIWFRVIHTGLKEFIREDRLDRITLDKLGNYE